MTCTQGLSKKTHGGRLFPGFHLHLGRQTHGLRVWLIDTRERQEITTSADFNVSSYLSTLLCLRPTCVAREPFKDIDYKEIVGNDSLQAGGIHIDAKKMLLCLWFVSSFTLPLPHTTHYISSYSPRASLPPSSSPSHLLVSNKKTQYIVTGPCKRK